MDDSAKRNKGGGSRPRIDEAAKHVFVRELMLGRRHDEAALAAGFNRCSFYRLRARDPDFAAKWEAAVERSSGPRLICPGMGRRLQFRRCRSVRFTDKRREIFLDRFAGTCNLADAALAAGVSEATVMAHRARDPAFAEQFRLALEQGYAKLEAELVRRRLEGLERLKAIEPTGEPEPEFDRAMKLLQRWDRRGGGIGPRRVSPGQLERWDFDDAIEELDRKLRALGARSLPPPPGAGGEEE